ncbi:hypothetical protein [Paenibacillus sp. V4I5]|uniref:hypothetical protein n=1 Tax=Paenibacillus sp. V4I5 TaxID=3042306 RepID=UPI00278EBC3A|nr:hypothetical protein [Paenibacillus sp. V4I5]MDQ0916362.1 hypothetical protein [Paenibacillus sp. V4I5]
MEVVLHPYESIVLLHVAVFEGYDALPQYIAGAEFELKGEWIVSTSEAEHYPRFKEWGRLADLTNMSRPEYLPRFTGTFRYETEFEWDESANQALLDLGEVYETAQVCACSLVFFGNNTIRA